MIVTRKVVLRLSLAELNILKQAALALEICGKYHMS